MNTVLLEGAGITANLAEATKLGSGGQGDVYDASGHAVKYLKGDRLQQVQDANSPYRQTVDALLAIDRYDSHPALLMPGGYTKDRVSGDYRGIWMPLIDLSSTLEWSTVTNITSAQREGFGLDQALEVAQQLVESVMSLHGQGILRADLNPNGNLRIQPNGRGRRKNFKLVILDMDGCLKESVSDGVDIEVHAQYRDWKRHPNIDKEADVFQVAVAIYELLFYSHPYGAKIKGETLKGPAAKKRKARMEAGTSAFHKDAERFAGHPDYSSRPDQWVEWLKAVLHDGERHWPDWLAPAQAGAQSVELAKAHAEIARLVTENRRLSKGKIAKALSALATVFIRAPLMLLGIVALIGFWLYGSDMAQAVLLMYDTQTLPQKLYPLVDRLLEWGILQ